MTDIDRLVRARVGPHRQLEPEPASWPRIRAEAQGRRGRRNAAAATAFAFAAVALVGTTASLWHDAPPGELGETEVAAFAAAAPAPAPDGARPDDGTVVVAADRVAGQVVYRRDADGKECLKLVGPMSSSSHCGRPFPPGDLTFYAAGPVKDATGRPLAPGAVFGTAPRASTTVVIERQDGATTHVQATDGGPFPTNFYLSDSDSDAAVTSVSAFDRDGRQVGHWQKAP